MERVNTKMDNENKAEVAETVEAQPSIDDTLNATFDAITTRETESDKAEDEQTVETTEEVVETEEITDQPEEEAIETEQATSSVDAPASWSAEQRKNWAEIPPETQSYIAEREKQVNDQFSRMGQEIAAFKPVGEALQQHEQTFARHGMTPIQGVQELLKVQDRLDSDPAGTLKAIADMYGVDLSQLANGGAEQGETSPQVAHLEKQVQSLQSRLTATEQQTEQQKQRDYELEVDKAKKELADSKIEEKPHYERLKPAILEILTSGMARDFTEAYEKAAWSDPEARKTLQEAEKKAELEAKAKAAAEAKKAAKVNVGAKSKQTVTAPKTWEETADAVADAVYAS